jgi:hypothetical protein
LLDEQTRFSPDSASLNGSESGGGLLSPLVLRLLPDPQLLESTYAGEKKKKNDMNPPIQLKRTTSLLFIVLGLVWLGLLPKAQAVSPPPDGGYPNFTTAEGQNALKNLTTGSGNTGVGWYSLFTATAASFNTGVGAGTLALNTGDNNTATGTAALLLNTTGGNNTANGTAALLYNTDGVNNTAVGSLAMHDNEGGGNNTGIGAGALTSNTTGNANTAIGVGALGGNTDGGGNTATGTLALSANNGALNTATGLAALQNNTTGDNNTAMGAGALNFNTIGSDNTGYGHQALSDNSDSEKNTAIGGQALQTHTTGNVNTAVGFQTLVNLTNGSANTAIGPGAGDTLTTGSSNVYIGNVTGAANESDTIRIGSPIAQSCFIGGIFSAAINVSGVPVYVDVFNQLGTNPSSRRFKKEIRPMDKTSEAILALKPVTFHYKSDRTNTAQFGLIAEEVAEVNPDLVVRDKNGDIYAVRYEQVNAMLLNEFLKEHSKVEKLEALVAQQHKDFEAVLADLKGQIQKVSAQLELDKPSSRTVLNDQ